MKEMFWLYVADGSVKKYVGCCLIESRRIIYVGDGFHKRSSAASARWTGNAEDVERIMRWAAGVDLRPESVPS